MSRKKEIQPILRDAIAKLWCYVRSHAGSLESERHCNGIEALVNHATDECVRINQQLEIRIRKVRADSRGRRARDKATIESLENELRKLKKDAETCETTTTTTG